MKKLPYLILVPLICLIRIANAEEIKTPVLVVSNLPNTPNTQDQSQLPSDQERERQQEQLYKAPPIDYKPVTVDPIKPEGAPSLPPPSPPKPKESSVEAPKAELLSAFDTTPTRVFSSRNTANDSESFIIYGDLVVVQKLDSVKTPEERIAEQAVLDAAYQKAVEDAKANQYPPPSKSSYTVQLHHKELKSGTYLYLKPKDGCYILENGFIFCCQNGHIYKVVNNLDPNRYVYDYFFGSNCNIDCKIMLFNVMYNFFYHQRVVLFHQYQFVLPSNLYPDMIYMIIFSKYDLIEANTLDKLIEVGSPRASLGTQHNFNEPLIAFMLSSQQFITIAPSPSNFKLYDQQIAQKYPLLGKRSRLIDHWIQNNDPKSDIFLTVVGPFVKFYNQSVIDEKIKYDVTRNDPNIIDYDIKKRDMALGVNPGTHLTIGDLNLSGPQTVDTNLTRTIQQTTIGAGSKQLKGSPMPPNVIGNAGKQPPKLKQTR